MHILSVLFCLGSAGADVGCGGKLNGHLMASCAVNMCTKNYSNWISLLQVLAQKKLVCFLCPIEYNKLIMQATAKQLDN